MTLPCGCKAHQLEGESGVKGDNPDNLLMVVGVIFTDVDEFEEDLRETGERNRRIYSVDDFRFVFQHFSP